MTKGLINVKKLNLLGYTPETQVYIIQNGGGIGSTNTFNFLQRNRKYFDNTTSGLALRADRIEKFRAYAESKGFEVEIGGWA